MSTWTWNGRIVSESTISSRTSVVRQAIGDSGERQTLIRTFPRKGYRFIGSVREAAMVSSITPPMSAQEPPAHPLAPSKQAMTFCRTH
jgi:DNA-binding winged helix-turn-helix (wHTH) protein